MDSTKNRGEVDGARRDTLKVIGAGTVTAEQARRDPLERNNLALERDEHAEVLEAMNAKLNALIQKEVGEDIGQMLPGGVDGGWVATDAVYDV